MAGSQADRRLAADGAVTGNPTPATGPAVVPGPAAGECDLASRWVGGTVVAASDESFGEKEHLLDPAPCDPQPGRYGPRGEIVDGWETRRRRDGPGEDWAIVRLGVQGVISAVDVDTTSFTGNHPVTCRIEATGCEGYPGPATLLGRAARWETIVPDQELVGNAHNLLAVSDERCWTHVRLVIAPDGGVARLRVHGLALQDPRRFDGISVDLASWASGGLVVASSDDFYGTAQVLNRPDQARNMGEGWETRRRRDRGHDWVLIRLGFAGLVSRFVLDTSFYRYNASAAVSVSGSSTGDVNGEWPSCWRGRNCSRTPSTTCRPSRPRLSGLSASTPIPTGGSPASGPWATSTRSSAPTPGGGGGTRWRASRRNRCWPLTASRPPPQRRWSASARWRSRALPPGPSGPCWTGRAARAQLSGGEVRGRGQVARMRSSGPPLGSFGTSCMSRAV